MCWAKVACALCAAGFLRGRHAVRLLLPLRLPAGGPTGALLLHRPAARLHQACVWQGQSPLHTSREPRLHWARSVQSPLHTTREPRLHWARSVQSPLHTSREPSLHWARSVTPAHYQRTKPALGKVSHPCTLAENHACIGQGQSPLHTTREPSLRWARSVTPAH